MDQELIKLLRAMAEQLGSCKAPSDPCSRCSPKWGFDETAVRHNGSLAAADAASNQNLVVHQYEQWQQSLTQRRASPVGS